tara:strand:+ start:4532 stop:5944 length:1413 start_codon:yes stop_codon:yes gene_type:complete
MNIVKKINSISNISFILLLSILSFLIWYLTTGHVLIHEPFVWDDLHLFRKYSLEEITNAWTGNWDPDNLETPGYRPIVPLFYNFLGNIFNENTFYLRLFIFLMAISLIVLVKICLIKIGFTKVEITIFSFLIIFSKIFTTLVAWMTMSVLILSYITAFISLIFFLLWLEDKKIKNYLISLLFAFFSIFTKEDLYILPGLFFLFCLCLENNTFKKIKKIFYGCIPIGLLVLTHIFLRKTFVSEAQHFEISFQSITFGGEVIGFGNLIKVFKASFLPMGYFSSRNLDLFQSFISIFWIILILLISIINFLNRKKISLSSYKILIFILLVALLSLPNITIARSFGIFLPSVFALGIICILINNLVNLILNTEQKLLIKKFYIIFIFLLVSAGVIGGHIRSNQHINSMNSYSEHILEYDIIFVYKYTKSSIPEKRLKKKIEHLKSLNINEWISKDEYKNLSNKILFPKYHPLDF